MRTISCQNLYARALAVRIRSEQFHENSSIRTVRTVCEWQFELGTVVDDDKYIVCITLIETVLLVTSE